MSPHVQLVGTKVRGMSVSWAWQADCPMGHANRVVTPKGALVFPICICEKCGILWRPPGSPADLYEKEGARCR